MKSGLSHIPMATMINEYFNLIINEYIDTIVFWLLWAMSLMFALMVMTFFIVLRFKKPDENIKIIRRGDE